MHQRAALLSVLLLATVGAACSPPLQAVHVRSALHAGSARPGVMVVLSEPNPVYDQVLEAFTKAYEGHITVYSDINDEHTSPSAVQDAVQRDHPGLVFALGDAAARLLWEAHLELPVLFALVVNPQELGLLQNPHFFGISMTTPPIASFTRFKGALPQLQRVVAPYQLQANEAALQGARAPLAALGVELVPVSVADVGDLAGMLREKLQGADAVWMIADPVVVNQQAFKVLHDASLEQKKFLLTTVSDRFTSAGALMSVSADFRGMGSLAALLAFRVLEQGTAPKDLGLSAPFGAKLTVNLTTAERLSLELGSDVMRMVGGAYR